MNAAPLPSLGSLFRGSAALSGAAAAAAAAAAAMTHGVPLQGAAYAAADATADVSVSGAGTIAFRSLSSAPQAGITSVLFRQPDTLENTDLALWCVVNKYPTAGPNTPTGYTQTAQAVMGDGGAAGADQGDVYATVFHRVCDGTEDAATESISIPSGNAAYSRSIAFSRSGGTGWDIATAAGSQGAASASWSITTGNLDLAAGDMVAVFIAKNSDLDVVGHSGHSFSASGVTFGTFNSRAGPSGTTQGDDVAYQLGEVQVTAGSGSGPVTVTMSASGSGGNSSGGVMLVRLRAATAVDLAGAAVVTGAATGGLSHGVPLAGAAAGQATGTGSITHGVPLAVAAAGTAAATGQASVGKPLAGDAAGVASAAGAIDAGGAHWPSPLPVFGTLFGPSMALVGAAVGEAAATGDLSHGVPLQGDAFGLATGSAAILVDRPLPAVESFGRRPRPGRGPYSVGRYFRPRVEAYTPRGVADLAGAAVAASTASGGLSHGVPLAGNAAAAASATAGLQLLKFLNGSAAGQSGASGSLDGSIITLAGAAVAQATAVGGITHAVPLQGAAAAVAGAAGQLAVSVVLAGTALAQATASGAFLGTVNLSGDAAAQAGVSGALSLNVPLGAQAQAIAAAAGGLVLTVVLDGDAVASAGATGALLGDVMMSGTAVGQASATGTLRVIGYAVFTRPPHRLRPHGRRAGSIGLYLKV